MPRLVIAGGSVEKAKEHGEALVALPDKRGEYQGRMVLAGIAAHEKDWAEMSRQFTLAETAGGVGLLSPPPLAREHGAWTMLAIPMVLGRAAGGLRSGAAWFVPPAAALARPPGNVR